MQASVTPNVTILFKSVSNSMDNIKRPVYPFNVQPNAVDNIKVFNLDKSGQVSYLHV